MNTDTTIQAGYIPEALSAPVVITLPRIIPGEAEAIDALSHAGASRIHIRKPEASEAKIEQLLQELVRLRGDMSRFSLHYNEPLAIRYGLGGVHLQGQTWFMRQHKVGNLQPSDDYFPVRRGTLKSCSAHSWEELRRWNGDVDYMFLSPLFDSVSKPGYYGAIDLEQARRELKVSRQTRVIALGGITADTIARACAIGFDGAAALGDIWVTENTPADERIDLSQTLDRFYRLKRRWQAAAYGELQFISDGDPVVAEQFLQAGGRWIQLRMKDASPDELVSNGKRLLNLCRKYGALLLINDRPELLKDIGADGVHLGKNDMAPHEARKLLGKQAIIGGTANTFEDIQRLSKMQVDYIGLGPLRFTTTKKNLSPVIGFDDYAERMRRMRDENIGLHVVAIGSVEVDDVEILRKAGVPGIAIAGNITNANDVVLRTREFLKVLQHYR